jgi:Rhamnan synthesis protein F
MPRSRKEGDPGAAASHPLFDKTWYLETNPDVAAAGIDPLRHYLLHGCAEGRKPNPFFDPEWYLARYPDVAAAGVDPVQHFIKNGADEGRDPSPFFQTLWYAEHYVDVAASAMNPLAHYLRFGRKEGREANGRWVDFSACKLVTATAIDCRKKPETLRREVALFVSHSPCGRLKPHVRHYLESLASEGIAVILVIAADLGFAGDEPWLYDLVDGLYVRANEGWDWACWAHVLALNPQLYRADVLYWLNDSLIGPVNQEAFHALLERLRANRAGLVALTANHECGWHLQSYFLAFKRQALESPAFQKFVLDAKCLPTREHVINGYEIRFARNLEEANITTAALFTPNRAHNPTVHNWKQLLEEGFPFLKQVVAITNDAQLADESGWRAALQHKGYDVTLADRLVAELANARALSGPGSSG